MADARVALTGIRAMGRHGANPGERLEPQEFVVDLDVTLDVTGDTLDETVDYRALADAARETVETSSFELLESLARAVARAVHRRRGVVRVSAVVHKRGAAASMSIDDVWAEATVE